MEEAVALQAIASRYAALASLMDERWRRLRPGPMAGAA